MNPNLPQQASASQGRGRGRPRKYKTAEEAYEARLAQNRKYNKTQKYKDYQKEYQKTYHQKKNDEIERLKAELERVNLNKQPFQIPNNMIGGYSPEPVVNYNLAFPTMSTVNLPYIPMVSLL